MDLKVLPETPPESCWQRERWDIRGFLKGPVVGGKGPGQGHLAKGNDEVHAPEEHEELVKLQVDGVLVAPRNAQSYRSWRGCSATSSEERKISHQWFHSIASSEIEIYICNIHYIYWYMVHVSITVKIVHIHPINATSVMFRYWGITHRSRHWFVLNCHSKPIDKLYHLDVLPVP